MKFMGWEIRYEPGPDRVDTRVADLLDRLDRVRADASAMVDGYNVAIQQAGQSIKRIESALTRLGGGKV